METSNYCKRWLFLLLLVFMVGGITGCVKTEMETPVTRTGHIPRPENEQGFKMFAEAAEQIANGNIYEITENQFQEGYDHDYSLAELEVWKEILGSGTYELKAQEIIKNDIRYMIFFYDDFGGELLLFVVDKKGRLIHEDGYQIINQEITKLLPEVPSPQNNLNQQKD